MTSHTRAQRKHNQCARTTLRGTRCKMKVVPGTLYCKKKEHARIDRQKRRVRCPV